MTQRLLSTGLLAAVLALSACADLNPTTQRTMTGAAGGAAGGALIGALAGNAGLGAAIGAAAGGTGGFIWDRHVQSQERAFQQGVAAGRASAVQ
ncbi:MAG: YMGG-like glycine zipper-containing protein [Rhodopila sp.]